MTSSLTPFTLHKQSEIGPDFSVLDELDKEALESSANETCCICLDFISSNNKIEWFKHSSGENPHYIDKDCLKELFKSKQGEKTLPCPLCKISFSYPYSIEEKIGNIFQRIFEKSIGFSPTNKLAVANIEFGGLSNEEMRCALEKEDALFRGCDLGMRRQLWKHAMMAAIVSGNASLLEKAIRKISQNEQTLPITNVFLGTVASAIYPSASAFFGEQVGLFLQTPQQEELSPELIQIRAKIAELRTSFFRFLFKVSQAPGGSSSYPEELIKLQEFFHLVESVPSSLTLPRDIQPVINLVHFSKALLPTFPHASLIFRPVSQDLDKILENFFALNLLNNKTPDLSLIALALASLVDLNLAKKIISVLDMATISSTPTLVSFSNRLFTCYDHSQARRLFPETFSPLHIAALRGSLDLLKTMLQKGASLQEANATSDLLGLAFLSRFWNLEESKELVGFLLSEPTVTKDQHTLLRALGTKEQEWIEQVYAKTSARDIESALIETIESGDLFSLKALTRLGADPTQIGKSGGSSAIRRSLSLASSSKQKIVSHLIECFKDEPIPEKDISDMVTAATSTLSEPWLSDLIDLHASVGLTCFNTPDSKGHSPLSRWIASYLRPSLPAAPIADQNNIPARIPNNPVVASNNAETERKSRADQLLRILIKKGADPSLGTPSIFKIALTNHIDYDSSSITLEALEILLSSGKIQVDFAFFQQIFSINTPIALETFELFLKYAAQDIEGLNEERSLIDLVLERRVQINDPSIPALLELLLKRGVPCSIRALANKGTPISIIQAAQIAMIKSKLWIKSWFSK